MEPTSVRKSPLKYAASSRYLGFTQGRGLRSIVRRELEFAEHLPVWSIDDALSLFLASAAKSLYGERYDNGNQFLRDVLPYEYRKVDEWIGDDPSLRVPSLSRLLNRRVHARFRERLYERFILRLSFGPLGTIRGEQDAWPNAWRFAFR
jgi:hypothetical protein